MKETHSKPPMGDKFNHLLSALYDAALDPDVWATIAELLPRTFNADGCLVQQIDLASRTSSVLATSGVEGADWSAYERHYCRYDLWAIEAGKREKDTIHFFHDLVPPTRFENSEIYNDFIAGSWRERVFWGMGSLLTVDHDSVGALGILRTKNHGAFEEDERTLALQIVPHLRRAVQLSARLRAAHATSKSLTSTLDLLSVAVILVRGNGSVAHANVRALELLEIGDGVRLSADGHLLAEVHAEGQRLRKLIYCAAERDFARQASVGGAITITRPRTGVPLLAIISPLSGQTAINGSTTAGAMVLVCDPLTSTPPAATILAALFGLTPAEAALAIAIADGKKSMRDVARDLHCSNETARTRLKSVFQKMNVSRQAEMAALLNRLGLFKHKTPRDPS